MSFSISLFRDDPDVPRRVRQFRILAARILVVEQWVLLAPIAVTAHLLGNSALGVLTVGCAAAALSSASYAWRGTELPTRMVICLGMLMDVLLLIYALSGSGSWQMDGGHMWVFAIWTHCMALLCWRSLIVSGFLGVAHHFLLVYLLPLWVFPDGADLWRVLLHGAVVIMQMVAFTPFIILVISMLRNAEQLEAMLHESAIKAREADNAKSSFLANMSHELRTPLNAIIGFTEAMKLELFGPLGNARYKTYSADVHGAGRHLLAVISELLDLAKISAGKMEVYAEEIEVAVFCRELLAMSATLATANRNTMSLQLDDVPARFGTDPTKLRQILLNLISNACKYTTDGTIELRAARDQAHPGGLIFTVVDTGIGIAEGDRSRIFEMFSQVNGAVTRPQGGTGLGLAVTEKLVHLLGGDLSCQSELGKGSAFKVRLRGLTVDDRTREMAGRQLVA